MTAVLKKKIANSIISLSLVLFTFNSCQPREYDVVLNSESIPQILNKRRAYIKDTFAQKYIGNWSNENIKFRLDYREKVREKKIYFDQYIGSIIFDQNKVIDLRLNSTSHSTADLIFPKINGFMGKVKYLDESDQLELEFIWKEVLSFEGSIQEKTIDRDYVDSLPKTVFLRRND